MQRAMGPAGSRDPRMSAHRTAALRSARRRDIVQDALVSSYRERRQRGWDRSVAWSRRHPTLSMVATRLIVIMTAGWALFLIVSLAFVRFASAAFWAAMTACGAWTAWSLVRIRRGETTPTGWPWHRT
jgi:hypothetical protein